MASTLKTKSDGDIVRLALESFHNQLKFIKTINRQYDKEFGNRDGKNGGTLLIRNPNEYEVTTGAVMDVQDTTETTQTITRATQKHIALMNFTSAEMTNSVEDIQTRFLDPAMSKLAAMVEFDVLSNIYKDVFNLTGTPATTPASLTAVLNANARLSQGLAPMSDRHLLLESLAMAATVASVGAYFHKASELERAFSQGYIGEAAGLKWWESNMVPTHTNGSRTDSTPITDTSGWANGDTTITTTGQTNAQTLKAGDVFTVAGVYAVNLETKQAYSYLQPFVVRTNKTCDTTDVFDVAPTIYTSGPRQNVSVTSAGSGKAIVHVAAGGSGTASAIYAQNLAYHRDAFTFVSGDLHQEPGQRMSTAVIENISMRLWRGADIVNDRFPTRIDVLYGYKTIRPEWAVRVRG